MGRTGSARYSGPMFEMFAAGLGLAVCVGLLLRQMLPLARRRRLDETASHLLQALRRLPAAWATRRGARRETQDAIDRARRAPPAVRRDGNVYRPDSFSKRPTKDDKLH